MASVSSISIKKRIRWIFFPMILSAALFIAGIICTFGIYQKNYQKYIVSFSEVSSVYQDLCDFNITAVSFSNYGGDFYLTQMQTSYEKCKYSLTNLYNRRYYYEPVIRTSIEAFATKFETVKTDMNTILENADSETVVNYYRKNLNSDMYAVLELCNNSVTVCENCYKQGVHDAEVATIVISITMIASFIVFLFFVIYNMIFTRTKIIQPISDIVEWSGLFKEDYAEMSDLEFQNNKEFSEIAESFNHVKQMLAHANKMKAENEQALVKLHNEEEYHKKFVQKFHEEKREKDTISAKAKRDGLTGLYNRRSFDDLVEEFLQNKPTNATGAMYLIDMDYFKNVNDTLGHLAGDEALKQLGGVMSVVFPGAYLGRYGGDEFVVFMTTGNEDIFRLKANELCRKMDRDFVYGNNSVHLSVSVGVTSTEGFNEYSEMYMVVDRALYYAKEHGRNQYKYAADLDE